jgi:RimJ/RimL family protein N-acetyltransferase
VKLLNAYTHPDAVDVLWKLLFERQRHQSISHREMPTLEEHLRFIGSHPYPYWYLIDCGDLVGSAYLTGRREVGIGILRAFWRNGYGRAAVNLLLEKHGRPLYANINPYNRVSIEMFAELGFRHIQNTYALEAEC